MENQLVVEIKKSALQAQSEYDFDILTKSNNALLALEIKKDQEGYLFTYETNDVQCLANAKGTDTIDMYRILLNILDFAPLANTLKLDLHPENIYVDYTLKAKMAFRDVYTREEVVSEEVFVKQYLCLLGAVLQDKYTYEQYQESGVALLQKSKITAPFVEAKTSDEIRVLLIQVSNELKQYRAQKLKHVSKKEYQITTWVARIGIAVIVALVGLCSYLYIYQNRHLEAINHGYQDYIAVDYVKTIDGLKEVNIDRMDATTKYVLAVSYVKADSLTDKQKENILSNLAISSNKNILNFWVHLSKENHDEAIDLAKLLGDEEYLAYGYMKKKNAIQKDSSLSGAEKKTQTEEIDKILEGFKDKQSEEE